MAPAMCPHPFFFGQLWGAECLQTMASPSGPPSSTLWRSGKRLAQKDFGRLNLSRRHFHIAKHLICKAIYQLAGLNLGPDICLMETLFIGPPSQHLKAHAIRLEINFGWRVFRPLSAKTSAGQSSRSASIP